MNALAVKTFVVVLILSVVMFGGCRWQAKLDGGKIARAEAKVETLRGSLKAAAGALRADAARFREIDTATGRAQAEATRRAGQAQEAAGQARAGQRALADELASLQRQAARDAKSCSIEEARICGSSLR